MMTLKDFRLVFIQIYLLPYLNVFLLKGTTSGSVRLIDSSRS